NRSFLALTITLPLIGGICFSVGAKRIQRFTLLKAVRFRSAWQAWRVDRARRTQTTHEFTAASFAKNGELLEEQQPAVDATALGVYMHGYTRGQVMPQKLEPHHSVYEYCKDVLQQWIAAGV